MSGHSKWATIKHKKGAADKARGKLFAKLARQIEVASREGGANPELNAQLRNIVQKAKAAQMTNDAIDRAVLRGAEVFCGFFKRDMQLLQSRGAGTQCIGQASYCVGDDDDHPARGEGFIGERQLKILEGAQVTDAQHHARNSDCTSGGKVQPLATGEFGAQDQVGDRRAENDVSTRGEAAIEQGVGHHA